MKPDETKLCEVGDTLYRVSKNTISTVTITDIIAYPTHYVYKGQERYQTYFSKSFGKSLFKTREEAEQEVYKKSYITKKKELLKNYEEELNKKFNLGNHTIVK